MRQFLDDIRGTSHRWKPRNGQYIARCADKASHGKYYIRKKFRLGKLSTIDKVIRFQGAGATPVHKAIEAGHLHMVNEVFINEMGFLAEFYTPEAKLTLFHTLIKKRANNHIDDKRRR